MHIQYSDIYLVLIQINIYIIISYLAVEDLYITAHYCFYD